MKVLATLSLLLSVSFCAKPYPGDAGRPILNDNEAALFTKPKYLQGWTPPAVSTTVADYTVGGAGGYKTVQAAVNAAVKAGGAVRKHIKINPGIYQELVYIPRTEVPITLYGAGRDAADTVISLNLSAHKSGLAYKKLFGGSFIKGDPAYEMYSSCASKTVLGIECSSVVWARANNVQIVKLTIENLSKRRVDDDQAVALHTQGDQTQVSDCRILGHQNTFWSGATGTTVSRGHVTNSYIEGDIDFVFGGGSTVFERCTFHVKSGRGYMAVIFSPATAASHKYGFLVISGTITGDFSFLRGHGVFLARAWDVGVTSNSSYIVGTSPNGQLVVRESSIDDILGFEGVYLPATSTGRDYVGNNATDRNFNDHRFNRFFEFRNTGAGASFPI